MLIIPFLMLMVYARVEPLLYPSQPGSDLIIYEASFIAGGLAVVIGIILFVVGWPETKKGRRILEIASRKKEVSLSEISAQTGFSEEYIHKVIAELLDRGFLSGFLEDDRFVQRTLFEG